MAAVSTHRPTRSRSPHRGAVEHHPAVLLADEVEHREVGQAPPEHVRPERVQPDPEHQPGHRHQQVQPRPAAELAGVEVDAEHRGPDVGHVDQQHADDPGPLGGVVLAAVEPAEVRPDGQGQERHGRAAEERDQIDRGGEQPLARSRRDDRRGGRGLEDGGTHVVPRARGSNRHAAGGQHLLGGADPVVERLLEQRDAAQVGPGEVDAAERLGRLSPVAPPDEPRRRPDHRVTPAHHVEPAGQLPDVGVGHAQVGQRDLGPARRGPPPSNFDRAARGSASVSG